MAARVAPKYTMLLAGVGSKLVPVIVIVVPTGPEMGAIEVMMGACANDWMKVAKSKKTGCNLFNVI